MEIGNLIYLIIGLVILVMNVVGSSNKRKKEQEKQEAKRQQSTSIPPVRTTESDEDWWLNPSPSSIPKTPKGIPATPYVRKEFQSSLGTLSNYAESSFERPSSRNFEKRGSRKIKRVANVHPILHDLVNKSGTNELRKAFIYSEIFPRKY